MSTTIPPLVCDTPPPIDEFEDISGDEDISIGANGSHFEDEIPSPTPSFHHHHTHNSLFSTDSFPVVEDISSDLNEMNSEFNDMESMDVSSVDVGLVANSILPPTDDVNEMINQNEIDSLETNRISQNRSSSASLDVMDISMEPNLNSDDNILNQSICINSQSLKSKRMDDSDFDEQRRWMENSNLVNDGTNPTTTDDGEENLGTAIFNLDEYKCDFNLNEKIIDADEQPASEIKSNELISTVQFNKENCDEKTLNEKFDADFSQFTSFQKIDRSVLSVTTDTPDQIESVQNSEIGTTSVRVEDIPHEVSKENAEFEDDEFGDFSSFSPPTIAASTPADITTAIDQVSMNSSSSSDNSKEDIVKKSKALPKLSEQKSTELGNLDDLNDVSDRSSGENFQQTTNTTNSSTDHETNADDKHQSYCKNIDYNLNVRAILSTLFPRNIADIDPEDDIKNLVKCSSRNGQIQFMNELTIHLKNVENTKALKHQWAKSVAKTFLVKSLGIDSRNILYGEKWNSSAPKFAANLGMSPLQPMKLNTNSSSDSSEMKSSLKATVDVPAAQFDWNSSGLINPLDGSRKSAHEERNEIPLESPKQWNDDGQTVNKKRAANIASETAKILSTISSPIVPEIETRPPNNSNEPNTVFDSTNGEIESEQTSDSYNVPGSSGTMKETHIFTPNKSQPEIDLELSGDSNSVDKKPSAEDIERVVIIKENVVKKEYRDIEYDPERVISLDEFSDFQFVNTATTIANEQIASERVQIPSIGLRSNAVINDNSELNSAAINRISNCNGFEKTYTLNMPNTLPIKQTTQTYNAHELKNVNYNQIENLKRSDESMLVNNTNYHNDISICSSADIQPITSQTYTDKDKIASNAPTMMLSNILKPQLVAAAIKPAVETSIKVSPNIEWPGPGIDTDQLMRLEQRFCAQPQVNGTAILANGNNAVNNSSEKCSEEDEWSEFVSVEQPQTPITNILSKNLLKQQTDEDDWSEFVSSTVPMSNTKRTISNNQALNYNIESANDSANRKNTMYNISMNQRTSYMVPSHSEAPSMISNLPDLRFVTPKSLVHMPNSSLMKK